MKKKNKVLITSVVAIGIAAGSYFAFAGGGSDVAMAYSGYKVTENKPKRAKFGGEVIPNGIETISFDPTKGTYELAVKKAMK